MAYPSDLVRTKDWGTETLTDSDLEGQLDLIINWIMAALDSSTGHTHDGSNKGAQILTGGIKDDAVTFAKVDDDGDFGPFTGAWQFDDLEADYVSLPEGAAPTVAASEGAIYTKDTSGQPELFFREESDGDEVQLTDGGQPAQRAGEVVQTVNTQDGAVNTGSTVMPYDDTIPQNTEGDEYMSLAITPKSATNKLKIDITFSGTNSSGTLILPVALFQDTTADALAVGLLHLYTANYASTVSYTYYMTAGTTSATTFKVRAGCPSAGTTTFNGHASARKMGGVLSSSITISEIKV